ncbi:hypothetical protein J2W34_000418 [Variovorax boronicumulans]|uniref:DUF2867 domain-containing protein n=1 Tax=Variovorax boronicumulans TaxID=436515 RepID=UPI0027896B1C|nr:DUF2867 domain-containing protein [Variovorax boronicumulans]MDQ0068644.1 hypothetical protein [Variovorax boronicumulans]
MPSELTPVKPVALPTQSAVAAIYESTNLADAFAIQLPLGTCSDPDVLWRFLIAQQPAWIGWLTNIRDAIVASFGLKTAKHLATLSGEANADDRIGIFKVYGRSESEIVLGEDDKHLDFRLSVLHTPDLSPTRGGQLTVSTVVHCHSLLGRAYLSVIAPFHRQVVKASLRRAAHVGWPKTAASVLP